MSSEPCVYIVDDDFAVRDGLGMIIENAGLACQSFASAEQFLGAYCPGQRGCLLLDVNMPGMTGDELQEELNRRNSHLPIIFLTAYGTIPLTVRSIKAGAVDFLTKPVPSKLLLERIQDVLQEETLNYQKILAEQALCDRLNNLTAREMEIMAQVVAGYANKEIARNLGISYRTVEVHRGRVMEKTGANTILELGRLCEARKLLLKSTS
ncbi:MAG: response regulator [Methylococcales bacterium]